MGANDQDGQEMLSGNVETTDHGLKSARLLHVAAGRVQQEGQQEPPPSRIPNFLDRRPWPEDLSPVVVASDCETDSIFSEEEYLVAVAEQLTVCTHQYVTEARRLIVRTNDGMINT
ncbi:unnamed protein product, partial [Amoebophrya sp. A120]|eukprot:GSA120T00005989001.1